jgi:hypothetical protein
MEQKSSVWKDNFNNGLIMGITGIVYTLLIYFLDLTFNQYAGYFYYLVQLFLMYYLLKSYRDNYKNGYLTYGQAFGAGVVISVYAALLSAVFTYILYSYIDTDLIAKQLAFVEETYIKNGMPQTTIDSAMKVQAKIMKPAIMAPISIFGGTAFGAIVALIVAIFVKKEGNPLID